LVASIYTYNNYGSTTTSSSGTITFGSTFVNQGPLNVNSGVLQFQRGTCFSNNMIVATGLFLHTFLLFFSSYLFCFLAFYEIGGTLEFTSSTYNVAASCSISGSGSLWITSASTFNCNGTVTINSMIVNTSSSVSTAYFWGTVIVPYVNVYAGNSDVYVYVNTNNFNITTSMVVDRSVNTPHLFGTGIINILPGATMTINAIDLTTTVNIFPGASLGFQSSLPKSLGGTINNNGTFSWSKSRFSDYFILLLLLFFFC
jgi:hypothetical protein